MARGAWFAALVVASLACVSVTGPRAVRPGTTQFGGNLDVDTLTPLLEWQPEPGAASAPRTAPPLERAPLAEADTDLESDRSVCYDLTIHEAAYEPGFSGTPGLWLTGARAYHRECIASTSHRLESPLLPGRDYHWYVRSRRGAFVGPWSRFQYSVFVVLGASTGSYYSYHLRTAERAEALADATGDGRDEPQDDEP